MSNSNPKEPQPMRTSKLLAPVMISAALFASAPASAKEGAVHRLLTQPLFDPAGATLEISPPAGGQIMIDRQGKAPLWFIQPGIVQVQPGVMYEIAAVRDNAVVFSSQIMARPGVLDVRWPAASNQPAVAYHPPAVYDPLTAVGLVPFGAVAPMAVRTPVTEEGLDILLDEVQAQPFDPLRWQALTHETQAFLFSDAQAQRLIDSFDAPEYQAAAARWLARRRVAPTLVGTEGA